DHLLAGVGAARTDADSVRRHAFQERRRPAQADQAPARRPDGGSRRRAGGGDGARRAPAFPAAGSRAYGNGNVIRDWGLGFRHHSLRRAMTGSDCAALQAGIAAARTTTGVTASRTPA